MTSYTTYHGAIDGTGRARDLAPEDDLLAPGLFASLWQYKWLVVATTVAALLVGLLATALQPRQYEAVSSILLANPNESPLSGDPRGNNVEPFAYASTQAFLLLSDPVVQRASEQLTPPISPQELQDITATSEPDALLLTVRVVNQNADRAAAIANAVPAAYEEVAVAQNQSEAALAAEGLAQTEVTLERELASLASQISEAAGSELLSLEAERAAIVEQITDVVTNRRRILIEAQLFGSGVIQREAALADYDPIAPDILRTTAIAGLFGLLIGSLLAWFLNTRSMHEAARHNPKRILGAAKLGEIPHLDRHGAVGLLPAMDHNDPSGEAYRRLLTALSFRLPDSGGVLLVTSAQSGDGKSLTSLNLAVGAAISGHRVQLIDADPGLTGASALWRSELSRRGPQWPGARNDSTEEERSSLSLEVTGFKDRFDKSGEVLKRPETIEGGRAVSDLVIIDAPAVLQSASAMDLAGHVDGVLVVVTPNTTELELRALAEHLQLGGAVILGYVTNHATSAGRVTPTWFPRGSASGASPVRREGLEHRSPGVEEGSLVADERPSGGG